MQHLLHYVAKLLQRTKTKWLLYSRSVCKQALKRKAQTAVNAATVTYVTGIKTVCQHSIDYPSRRASNL